LPICSINPALIHALAGQVEALKSENATLKDQLSRADAQLAHERTRADRAISEFSALADRLAKLAEARSPMVAAAHGLKRTE
jgi:hypothetical protein